MGGGDKAALPIVVFDELWVVGARQLDVRLEAGLGRIVGREELVYLASSTRLAVA